jgi:hypothetical protein
MSRSRALAALRWLAAGYGYEITGADVWSAYAGEGHRAGGFGPLRDPGTREERSDEVEERLKT